MSADGHHTLIPAVSTQERQDREVGEFFARYQNDLRAYLIGVCRCPNQEVEDIMQDTIMLIRKHWPLDNPKTYGFTIAVRRFRREQGKRARELCAPDEQMQKIAGSADPYARADAASAGMAILRQLPIRQRQVLYLRSSSLQH